MSKKIRKLVSKKKKRFKLGKFDLDLSYITSQIIAMGFPSSKIEGLYRNKMEHVQKFFDTRHNNKYKIYNLCSERSYDHSKFHYRVARYPFDDHNPPVLELIEPFCRSVDAWVKQGDQYITSIHCKAGKGRTGCLICCWMVYNGDFETAQESMEYYSKIRTKNEKGVTIPSQKRYIHYFTDIVKNGNRKLYQSTIDQLVIGPFKKLPSSNLTKIFNLKIYFEGKVKLFDCKSDKNNFVVSTTQEKMLIFKFPNNIPVVGDIRVSFYQKKKKIFQFWFHTSYVDKQMKLFKINLDSACKNKKVEDNFSAEIFFSKTKQEPQIGVCGVVDKKISNATVKFEDYYLPNGQDKKNLKTRNQKITENRKSKKSKRRQSNKRHKHKSRHKHKNKHKRNKKSKSSSEESSGSYSSSYESETSSSSYSSSHSSSYSYSSSSSLQSEESSDQTSSSSSSIESELSSSDNSEIKKNRKKNRKKIRKKKRTKSSKKKSKKKKKNYSGSESD
ncbi:phosphatase with homology to tensin [Anaeramoeba flamelloides]|uniref:Phosphatase with homology to tensin n=1 Tax=Anaeramoeba flamelloides TaxID=1746091 RepID=A0ABQ8YCA7_9EUKA|nr:phosphatase with homology to tensin [Anaeramoeba flamelloides]